MTQTDVREYAAHAASTDTFGRVLATARNHYLAQNLMETSQVPCGALWTPTPPAPVAPASRRRLWLFGLGRSPVSVVSPK
jgi:hypothetical protein